MIATRPRKPAADARGLVVRRYGKSGRGYRLDGDKLVSVSEVKNTFPKQLTNYGARCERAHVLAVLEYVLDGIAGGKQPWTPSGVAASVLEACGERFAWVDDLNRAGTIGTAVHTAIEHYNAALKFKAGDGPDPGPAPELDGPALVSFDKFTAWAGATDYFPIASEISVCSATHRWAGTLDELAIVEGRTAILDWKSGPRTYLEDRMQVAAYLHGYNEYEPAQVRGFPTADRAILVNIPKQAEDAPTAITTIEGAELATLYETFLMAVPLTYRLAAYKAARDAATD